MNDFILSGLTELEGLSLPVILLNNAVAVVMGLFIMLAYRITTAGADYSKRFNVSLGMITVVTTLIMSVISNNIALSLGMVGALSIIRFRTAIKNVRDAVYIFWVIAVGIACGVSQYLLAAISSGILLIFLLIFRQVRVEGKNIIAVRCTVESQRSMEIAVQRYLGKKAKLVMKNVTKDACELIFEVPEGALKKAEESQNTPLSQLLMKVEGALSYNQVEQSENISR